MVWLDFEGGYKSKPASTTPQPDPFANFVDPYSGGSPTPANTAAWAPSQVGAAPKPYNPVTPPPENLWNSDYQMWQDPKNGALWDPDSGVWIDPATMNVYRENVGWQSIPEYNDYSTRLFQAQLEHELYTPYPVVAQPSLFQNTGPKQISGADWYNIDAAMSRPRLSQAQLEHELYTPYPSVGENINTLSGTYSGGYTRNEAASLPDAEAARRAQALTNFRQDWQRQEQQGLTLGGLLGSGLAAYNKYIANPIAETGAQLTPAVLELAKYAPGLQGVAAIPGMLGYDSRTATQRGVSELGSALKQSGGNPLTFAELQNENFKERPGWQQMASQAVFDPTNLIGAGLTTKALQGVKGEGLISEILRGAGTANQAIDTATAKALGGALKPLGPALKPLRRTLAEEGGAIPVGLAAKGAATVGAGAIGYATADDDMSAEDRFLRTLAFAAVPAIGPEATDIAARTYGKAPWLRERGLGRMGWLEDAPVTEILEGKDLDPVIYLKDVSEKSGLPARARLSNTFWKGLAAAGRKDALTKVDDEAFYWIARQHRANEGRIAEVAENMSRVASEDFAHVFTMDDKGRVLTPDGKYLPALDNDGNIQQWRGQEVFGATPADIADHADTYLKKGLISEEQHAALKRMADAEKEITRLRLAFGLPFEASPTVGPDGFHLTRGRASAATADTTPTIPYEARQEGRTPGGAKPRGYDSQAAALMDGKAYPHPIDALRSYIDQSLREVNAANSSLQLAKKAIDVELSTGKQVLQLGDLLKNQSDWDNLKADVEAIRAGKREIRKLKTRKDRIDRDVRLGQGWVDVNRNRAVRLTALATDQTISASGRAEAAVDALTLTRQALADARSAAAEYAQKSAMAQVRDTEARRNLNSVLTEAKKISNELNAIEDAIRAGETADLQQKVNAAWGYADTIRDATAADIAALERRLSDLPYDDMSESALRARAALQAAKNNFGGSLSELRRLEAEAIKLAKQEERAAANVRAAINEGRVAELNRLVEKRADQLMRLSDQSDELKGKIDALKNALLPLEQSRDAVKADIKRARDLSREMSEKFPTGTIKVKGWENVHMPHYLANAWRKYEQAPRRVSGAGEVFDLLNNAFRAIGATADASRTATIGLLGIAENPGTTARGIKGGVASAFDPEKAWHFLREIEEEATGEGLPSLAHAVGKYHLEIASSEHMLRGMADEGTLADRLAKLPGIRHAEALYATPGNIERAQRFYDYLRVLRSRGEDWTSDGARAAAANAANTVSGRASRGALDWLVGSRNGSRILFAGRFLQSQLDSVWNAILVGGIEGEASRRALLRLFGGGAALTYAVNEMLGNETDFNLLKDGRLNPDFMKIRALGQDISLFGPWESMVKGLAATSQLDPDYFLRGKLAPAAGIAWDVTIGRWRDPLDRPIDTPEGVLRMAPFPFGLRNIAQQAVNTDYTDPMDVASLGLGIATSMTGIKSSPLTPREQYTETLEAAHPDYKPLRTDGTPLVYPQPSDPYEDPLFIREFAAAHPDEVPGPATALGKEMDGIRKEKGAELTALNKQFANDQMNLGTWKEGRQEIKAEQRNLLEPLVKKMQEAMGHDPTEGTPAWWLNKYFQTFEDAKDPETGRINLERLDILQADFLSETEKSGAAWVMDYIDSYTLAGADPGPEREYLKAIQQLNRDGYFSGELPRYIGLTSGMSNEEIDKARRLVAGYDEKHPGLKDADFLAKAFVILRPLGYSTQQIIDVSNAGKSKFEHPQFTVYKMKNPNLIEWLDNTNYYSTLQSLNK